MDSTSLISEIYGLVILPLLIFFARVADVSLGTIRIIFITRGFKYIVPIIAFVEIMIWLLAVVQIFQHLTHIVYYVAYASGFAAGTFVGIWIENKLAIGSEVVRIVTQKDASELIKHLKFEGYGITVSHAEDAEGSLSHVIYMIVDRHDIPSVIEKVKKYNPSAFYSIEDIRFVSRKIFPYKTRWRRRANLFRHHRKGK